MASERAEVAVLGAGIAGAALAYHLARQHVGRVVVVDPRTPAAGATGRAAGIVTEQLWDPWDVEVVRESREEYARFAARLRPSAYRVNGFLRWTSDPRVAEALRTATERLRRWGVDVDLLPVAELEARLPGIRSEGIEAVSWGPRDAVVEPSTLAELYVGEARRAGVEFLLGASTGPLARSGSSWTVSTGETMVEARSAVVAAGAWSKQILRAAGTPLPLVPYRTQAALLSPPGGCSTNLPSVHDLDLDVYARPEEEGRLLAGDGTERVEADPETFRSAGDDGFVAHLAASFARRLPVWEEASLVRAWAGVCTATPDRRPLIGPVPSAPGLYVLTGFNGFGVMRAGGAACRLARAIVEGPEGASRAALEPVLPERFRDPGLAFVPRPGFTLEGGTDPRF